MANSEHTLTIAQYKCLRDFKFVPNLLDDGNIIYHTQSELYTCAFFTAMDGRIVELMKTCATLPCKYVRRAGAYETAIYFTSEADDKIYRGAISTPESIRVSIVRDKLEGESYVGHGLCTRKVNGNEYAYGMWANPDRDGILIDASVGELRGMNLIGIHRTRLIYSFKTSSKSRTSVRTLGENIIVLEASQYTKIYCNESHPYIYFSTNGREIYVLDSNSGKLVSTMSFREVSLINHIAGISDGIIIVKGWMSGDHYLIFATLPDLYIENSSSSSDSGTQSQSENALNVESQSNAHLQNLELRVKESLKVGNLRWETERTEERRMESALTLQQPTDNSREFSSRFGNEFIINRILGIGGFGIVFETTHVFDEWKYAVKRITVNLKDEKKALEEVKNMAKLDHPGIVRYNNTWIERPPKGWQLDADWKVLRNLGTSKSLFRMDYQDDNAFIYIQMQLCKYSLAAWLDENRDYTSRSPNRIMSWFKQIVSAVAYIHDMGLIHRDLKPGNILFANEDHLKVCDLGLATERNVEGGAESAITRTYAGTELYMSPENHELYAKYGSKSDMFALGLILAEMCVVLNAEERVIGNIVKALTQMDPRRRPTCKEILNRMSKDN